jgi:hypothetical protein
MQEIVAWSQDAARSFSAASYTDEGSGSTGADAHAVRAQFHRAKEKRTAEIGGLKGLN